MERQAQHAGDVVQVEDQAARLLVGAEGEEVGEDLAMDDHAGDAERHHRHAGQSDQPEADVLDADVQHVMKRKDEARAGQRPGVGQHRAGAGIDEAMDGARLVPPQDPNRGIAIGRQSDAEGRRLRGRRGLVQGAQHLERERLLRRRKPDHRRHPAVDLAVEHRQRAHPEDREQKPAQHDAGPGVQPVHRGAEALLHLSLRSPGARGRRRQPRKRSRRRQG